jgi:AcrR family transcriptional regulator
MGIGRESSESQMDAAQIEQYTLDRLADGDLLAEIAEDVGVKRTTLYMRFQTSKERIDLYTRAREEGLIARGERLRRLAHSPLPSLPNGGIDSAAVQQLKLQIDTEKWTLGKLLPKIYGDKVQAEVTGAEGKDLIPEMAPADVAREIAFILAKAAAEKDKDGS